MRCRHLVPLFLLLAASSAAGLGNRRAVSADASSLLQVSDAKVQAAEAQVQPTPRNLVLVFDGAFRNHSGTTWKLAEQLVNDSATQATFYEAGGNYVWGAGLRQALRGFKFLSEMHRAGDKVFIFAQSRGCIAGRYVQGLLHRFGLPRRPDYVDELEWRSYFEDHLTLEAWLSSGSVEVDGDVEIQAMGLMDAVLRVVWEEGRPFQNLDLRPLHLELTPKVRVLLHALALEEVSDYMQAAELVADPSTRAEQVWFMGDHNLMCTRNDIMLSWMIDRSMELGLLVQEEPAKHLDLNYCSGSPYKVKGLRNMVVRDPGACRKELYGGGPVKIHQSVRDRASKIAGWAPLTYCCHEEVLGGPIDWVSNPTYDLHKQGERLPQWLLLKLRISARAALSPLRFLLVLTDHGDYMVDVGPQEQVGQPAQAIFPYHNFSTEPEIPGMSPPSFLVIEGPCWNCPDLPISSFRVGSAQFWISGGAVLIDNAVHGIVGNNIIMDLETELLYNDEAAMKTLQAPDAARCAWLRMGTARRDRGSICPPSLPPDYPSTCEQLRTEATAGALHPEDTAAAVRKYYDELLRLSRREDAAATVASHLQNALAAAPEAFREQWALLLEKKPWLATYEEGPEDGSASDVPF